MKVSLLQATLWPLHTNKTISFLRSSPLHIIQGSPWTGIHLGDRDAKTINQKLARSPSIPCWVRRRLPLSGLADCSFLGRHLKLFGFLSAYRWCGWNWLPPLARAAWTLWDYSLLFYFYVICTHGTFSAQLWRWAIWSFEFLWALISTLFVPF